MCHDMDITDSFIAAHLTGLIFYLFIAGYVFTQVLNAYKGPALMRNSRIIPSRHNYESPLISALSPAGPIPE